MASPGEISYRLFITKLIQKASSRYISVTDIQSLGSYFWGMLSEDFKNIEREKHKRKAFWIFSLTLKECLIEQKTEPLFELWEVFDKNGRTKFESLFDNSIIHQVNRAL